MTLTFTKCLDKYSRAEYTPKKEDIPLCGSLFMTPNLKKGSPGYKKSRLTRVRDKWGPEEGPCHEPVQKGNGCVRLEIYEGSNLRQMFSAEVLPFRQN